MSPSALKDITVSPYEEMVAYETLWAIYGMSEKKLSDLFREQNALPSKVLRSQSNPQQSLFDSSPDNLSSLKDEVEKYIQPRLGNFSVVVNRSFQYPNGLRSADNPIELFYSKGNLDLLTTRCVSVVGARQASERGKENAARIAHGLVNAKFTIVSGLAAGIDTVAMTSAIQAGGNTIGVIGTPIDEYYPKENRELQDTIASEHLLISQVPFYRYKKEPFAAHKNYFPRRNVTMAAISEATIIVEASDTSGTLTQARACINQNKKLFILEPCFQVSGLKWPQTYAERGAIRVKSLPEILEHLK